MKKKFLAAVVFATTAFCSRAQDAAPVFINASTMKNIFISGNADVILLPAGEGEAVLSFDADLARRLDISSNGNSLRIHGGMAARRGSNTIYLTVGAVESLTLDGFVNVKTHSLINPESLRLMVGADATARVITSGKVKVAAYDGAEIKYEVRNLSGNSIVNKSL